MLLLKNKNTGHGIFKAPFYDREGWGHSGRIDEFRSFVGYFPDDSLSVAIVTNGMNFKLNELIIGVLSAWYGRAYEYPKFNRSEIDTPETDIFIGAYKAKLAGFITVAQFNISAAGKNHLFLNENNDGLPAEKSLLVRTGTYSFFSVDSGGEIKFKADKKGRIKGAELVQGKFRIRCIKVD
ncbi:MAG TPA: hypothetical protein DCQ58_12745 [Saprospirales bacterium]|nr:hypothetical protein [Saprospirales bacterium]